MNSRGAWILAVAAFVGGLVPAMRPLAARLALPRGVDFQCDFETRAADCGFVEQAKQPGRATPVEVARSGRKAVRLRTLPGDTQVSGSDDWERNDLRLPAELTDCREGREAWWAHSVLFPDDHVIAPRPGGTVVMDFHHTGSRGNANFHLNSAESGLYFHGFGGDPDHPVQYRKELGPIAKNVWYDFVYHVRWSSSADGFMDAWMNGAKVLSHRGPTLYRGMGCYLKLANYHSPTGSPSSIVHDRVVRGSSAAAVALQPLHDGR